ncbi:MAG: ATP-binding protein [Streptomycetaceae bacterium]|nr:ATP-binding protein [Streptomycetaceae bacterium]
MSLPITDTAAPNAPVGGREALLRNDPRAPGGRILAGLSVPSDPSFGYDVRRCTVRLLAGLGAAPQIVDDVLLLTTELFTNAVRHAPGADVTVSYRYDRDQAVFGVAIHDRGHALPAPDPRPALDHGIDPDALDESGRGLLVLAALAHDWGWHSLPSGKSVWFTVALPTS